MTKITITLETRDARHGRYVGRIEGLDDQAELTFTWRGDNVLSADHAGAPEALQGTGVAMALLERMVADARAQGFKIIPLCPYIRHKYESHPEWSDVMTSAPGEMPHIVIS